MAAWTRFVLRHRFAVLASWAVVLVLGGIAATRLSPFLSNTFAIPGTESERARTILQRHFGDRPDGTFTIVFRLRSGERPPVARLQGVLDRAAAVVPTGRPTPLQRAGDVLWGDVDSTLDLAQAKGYADALARAVGRPAGVERAYVTGAGPIQHALDPIFSHDLTKGESIAVPIALLVLVGVFGISVSVTMPFVFAACTILGALGIMYGIVHLASAPTYVTNVIELIGLGIAVDYSLLVVYRFREELAGGGTVEDAVVRTMQSAGRAVIFSGATVAIGLLLLVALPVPFLRMMGVAGFLIPIVSIVAAATLQPTLLALYGRRGVARRRVLPRRLRTGGWGFWPRLAHSIMRRPRTYLALGSAILLAAAAPVFWLALTPGSSYGVPRTPAAIRGFDVLRAAVGPGATSPTRIVVDAGRPGGARSPAVRAAVRRLVGELRHDPEVAGVLTGPGPRFVDPSARYVQLLSLGRHDYGQAQAQSFVRRVRARLVAAARFPAGTRVLVGGGPAQGVDFLDLTYRYVPWLIVAVVALTYLLLLRVFRSVLLPLKAVVLNLLSVAASYGMLVVVFRFGLGHAAAGLYRDPQVEGWIPPFLFATLFGLSMDYEVFLVTRMRETWDAGAGNAEAVAHGLERTGRIITAAAVIMVAAFSGFVTGRIVGLQEFGVGLATAVIVDATIVRCILVPSLMAVFGRWNWWLPPRMARLVRVRPSPVEG
ncbi:MAG TPA: MMPL family transporter [Gaiellaceae bacterium]|nr:MMPL family transporter [Gaiellaceae bacterium]